MSLLKTELGEFLERKVIQYNEASFVESDPVSVPHHYSRKEDIEIAGLISAVLAWGLRSTSIRKAELLLDYMDEVPYEFILSYAESDLARFDRFSHRTFNGTDARFFIRSLRNIYQHHQGIEQVFKNGTSSGGGDIAFGISRFRQVFFSIPHPAHTTKHLPDPLKNSSSKRINMFLRWMVRKDRHGVDFGLWETLDPSVLICPLDLHSGRVARKLGLLHRPQNDWKAACELTSALREFDPGDPVKYDYALFGLGIFEKF